ncbi:MAG: hypothetical protein ACHQ4H_17450 [Ktedonobacterales bacterium]
MARTPAAIPATTRRFRRRAARSHRYVFTLYTADVAANVVPGTGKQEPLDALRSHILAQSPLTRTYQRHQR